jgi:hypothetical protein
MGAGQSTAGAVLGAAHHGLLERLAGPEPIPLAAPFWDQLFSLQVPLASLDPADVELTLAPHCRQLREWPRFGLRCTPRTAPLHARAPHGRQVPLRPWPRCRMRCSH